MKSSIEIKKVFFDIPKVSIIVPTYKRTKDLKRALESLLIQTYPNTEIIVVDDNADSEWNEKISDIVNNFNHSSKIDFVYIRNKVNKGSAESRNIGIRQSTGKYITFLDDDDIYLPSKIENQVSKMIDYDADFSLTDLWIYDEKDNLVEKRIRNYIKDDSEESLTKYHLMFHMTGTDVMMFKKKYLIDIGLFSSIDIGDEFYLMQKAIEGKGVFHYLPGCDVKAYVHSETDGLSSGDGKVKGEKDLHSHKEKYVHLFSKKEWRYIKMRHYAVIAYAEYRRNNYSGTLKNAILSIISSPISFMNLVMNRK